jgi:AcrR family transcriptional regulator
MSPRAGLDRAVVVQAAARLADANPGELSLARLAESLHVRTPSLYKHVDGLPALRRDLALLGLAELERRLTDAAVGRSRDEAVRALAGAYRSFVHERPGLYVATIPAPVPGDTEHEAAAARVVAVVLRVLEGYGLQGDDAVHAVRALRSCLHGFASLEAAGGFGLPLDLDESFRRLVELFIEGLAT